MSGTEKLGHELSREYASGIMSSIVTGTPYQICGNVLNRGLISNLPADAVVEVPCLVDGNGIQGTAIGALPEQCAALNMTNINVQLLTIKAAFSRRREDIYHAAMLDPHTAGELTLDEITALRRPDRRARNCCPPAAEITKKAADKPCESRLSAAFFISGSIGDFKSRTGERSKPPPVPVPAQSGRQKVRRRAMRIRRTIGSPWLRLGSCP